MKKIFILIASLLLVFLTYSNSSAISFMKNIATHFSFGPSYSLTSPKIKENINPLGIKQPLVYIDHPIFQTYPNVWAYPSTEIIPNEGKNLYLTFDDGPSHVTSQILDILKTYDIKATFFVTCQTLVQTNDEHIAILKRIVDEGHLIGVHSYTHAYDLIYSSLDAYLADFDAILSFIIEHTGIRPNFFRFPGGSNTRFNKSIRDEVIQEMSNRGFEYYDWNVSVDDTVRTNKTPQDLINSFIRTLGNRDYAVVLLHDTGAKQHTADALPKIIDYAISKGYSFKALDGDCPPIHF